MVLGCYNPQLMIRNAKPRIVTDHDRFRDTNVFRLEPMTVQGGQADRLEIGGWCGADAKSPTVFTCALTFNGYSEDWRFLKVRDVNAIVDGARIPFADADHEGETRTMTNPVNGAPIVAVTEHLTVRATIEQLALIANARVAELQVGVVEFSLPPQHKQGLRDLLTSLGAGATDSTATGASPLASKAWIGVAFGALPDLADGTAQLGAAVVSLTTNGPGETGGLRVGDVVVGCNDKPVASHVAFRAAVIPTLTPGVPAKLAVVRNGKNIEVMVTPAEPPGSRPARADVEEYDS